MPNRPLVPNRKQTARRGRPRRVVNPGTDSTRRPPSAQPQKRAQEEEAFCKRIMDELGFSPASLAALRAFRKMHSPEE